MSMIPLPRGPCWNITFFACGKPPIVEPGASRLAGFLNWQRATPRTTFDDFAPGDGP